MKSAQAADVSLRPVITSLGLSTLPAFPGCVKFRFEMTRYLLFKQQYTSLF